MKKRLIIIISGLLFLACVNNAFAQSSYTKVYTVGSNGSESQKGTFDWGEKPWVYLELPAATYDFDVTISSWAWLGGAGESYSTIPSSDPVFRQDNKIWLSFSDTKWSQIAKPGDWTISPVSILFNGGMPTDFISGSTSCTVTPEPLSMVLFLTGAGALAANYRKKSVKAQARG